MSGKKFAGCLLGLCLTALSPAQAREGNTWADEFRIYSADIASQCTSVRDQLKTFVIETDPLTGYTLKDSVQSLCVCIPARLEALRSEMAPQDLARPVTEQQVLSLFNSGVIDRCAAEQMQAMYGADCPKRFAQADLDVPHYCSCMKVVMGRYTDAETAALAAAAQDYLPVAAEAEKSGFAIPPRPPVLEAYFKADQNCKGVRKSFEGLKP